MQDFLNSNSKDKIDLRELFLIFWAYKFLIIISITLGVVFSGHYALNADKKFTSTATFKLNPSGDTQNIFSGTDIGKLTQLAGISEFNSENRLNKDLITGRIFIEKIDAKLNFQTDPYFNTYNPNSIDPVWKSLIKRAISWQKSTPNGQEAIWQTIVANYIKNIELDETKDGSIKIIVKHQNAERAAKIANTIMNEVIINKKIKKVAEQDQQLYYLSNTLANALNDLENSQSKLKAFALENSALPLESFTVGSLQLDALRKQLNRTSELHDAVAELSLMLQNKTTEQNDYMTLRQKFPIIDQVEFRRVFGQNEVISSWSWPNASSVTAVLETLSDRKNRLESQLNVSQIDAKRNSDALETYAKLERDAKVAEATYTILIEQVKAQSILIGYRPDKTEVYEFASASIYPSEPKRTLMLALGAILGFFVGTGLSLVLAFSRDVFYSKKSLISAVQARYASSVKSLMPLRSKSLKDINVKLKKKSHTILRDIAVEVHKNFTTQVVVTSSRAKLSSSEAARSIGSYMQSENTKIGIIDFSTKGKKLDIDDDGLDVGSFVIVETEGQISVLQPNENLEAMEMLSQRNFIEKIQSLKSRFDLVFLCADNKIALNLLSALEGQKVFHITLARTKHTKTATIAQMRSLLPIQGILYD